MVDSTTLSDPGAAGDASRGPGGARVAGTVLAVNNGQLTTGTRLPPVRTLAAEVGVATATAAKVYRELEEAGVLEGRGRSGTFVAAADLPAAVLARAAEEFAKRAVGAGFDVDEAVAAVRNVFNRLR